MANIHFFKPHIVPKSNPVNILILLCICSANLKSVCQFSHAAWKSFMFGPWQTLLIGFWGVIKIESRGRFRFAININGTRGSIHGRMKTARKGCTRKGQRWSCDCTFHPTVLGCFSQIYRHRDPQYLIINFFTKAELLCGEYLSVVFPFEHYRFPSTAWVLFKFKLGPEFSIVLRLEHVFSCGFTTCEGSNIGRSESFFADHLPYHESTAAVLRLPVRTPVAPSALDDFSSAGGTGTEIFYVFRKFC